MPPLPLTCCTEFDSRACPWSPRNTCMSLPRNLGFVRISHVSDETCGEEFGLPTMNPAGVEHLEPATGRRPCHARNNPDRPHRTVPRCRVRRALRLLCVHIRKRLLPPDGAQQALQGLTKRNPLQPRSGSRSAAGGTIRSCRRARRACHRSRRRRYAPAPQRAEGHGSAA